MQRAEEKFCRGFSCWMRSMLLRTPMASSSLCLVSRKSNRDAAQDIAHRNIFCCWLSPRRRLRHPARFLPRFRMPCPAKLHDSHDSGKKAQIFWDKPCCVVRIRSSCCEAQTSRRQHRRSQATFHREWSPRWLQLPPVRGFKVTDFSEQAEVHPHDKL